MNGSEPVAEAVCLHFTSFALLAQDVDKTCP